MRVLVAPEIRGDHAEIRRLVLEAFSYESDPAVEVRVERARNRRESFTGRAYSHPPKRSASPGTRFLVRLRIPSVLRNGHYPQTYRYTGRTTAPWITVRSWRERLVALAAHEACHVRQFRTGARASEIEAERWAVRILDRWSSERTSVGQVALW